MSGRRRRVALLVPSSNTVMEPDFARGLPAGTTVHTARMLLRDVTADAEARMLDDHTLPAAERVATVDPDLCVFGCTSAGALRGHAADAALTARIAEITRAPTVSVITAVRSALEAIGGSTIAVATPYTDDLGERVVAGLHGLGRVVAVANLGLVDNREIGAVEPADITDFVVRELGSVAADVIFVSCTNFRAAEALDDVRAATGRPATSSNVATLDAVCRELVAAG